ncbi:hypothetical protein ACHAW5_000790 [Stephanodiscus triporus]|uniref:PRA1 family protein n=1 Tax=Stephanodiscus triporus TaxID=2934178 RepID=A0ABD3QI60_9STRA
MKLVADPADIGIVTPKLRSAWKKMKAKQLETGSTTADEGPAPITYAAALRIPMVAQYAFAFGFFKLTNYVLFFLASYFLGKHFDPVSANLIASLYPWKSEELSAVALLVMLAIMGILVGVACFVLAIVEIVSC